MYEKLPQELKDKARFCLWRREERNGKPTKVPYSVLGCHADTSNIATFADFQQVLPLAAGNDCIGIGVFEGYSAIDRDHCIQNGVLSEMAQDIVDRMDSYTETSPSGTGVRIVFNAKGIT